MSKLLTKIIAPCLLLFTIHCSLFTASAQTSTATLSGVVQDEKGAVIAGASVSVIDPARGLKRDVITNSEGQFTVSLLPPSTYNVMVEQDGFAKMLVEQVVLNVSDNRSLAILMQIKQKEEVVTVDAAAVAVRTDGGGQGTVMDRTFVSQLPLNGRSFSSLVLLTPGVTITTANTEGFGQFSVNGQRSSTNYFVVDGVGANFGIGSGGAVQNNNIALAGGYAAQSATGGTSNLVSQDAVQEFKVQTSGYTAESGRQPGGQVQVITRSGTNEFHGSVFDYLRNEKFDARNYFNKKPAKQTALRQNLFGGTFSGPVYLPNIGDGGPGLYRGKDRTFFFFSYEGHRLLVPLITTWVVPSLRVRAASIPSIKAVLDAYPVPTEAEWTTPVTCQPLPSDPTCAPTGFRFSGWARYALQVSNPTNQDQTSIRIDHALNKKHTLFGRFNESPSNARSVATTASPFGSDSVRSTRTLTLGLTSVISPTFQNELRVNWSRQRSQGARFPITFGGAVPVDLNLFTSGLGGRGTLAISMGGSTAVGGFNSIISGGDLSDNFQRQFNIVNNLTWIKSDHVLKFGVDYRQLSPIYALGRNQSLTFQNEAQVTSGRPALVTIFYNETAEPRFTNISAFVQDTWKASRRLTLDLGLRYELNPAPSEKNGRYPVVVTGITNPPDVSGVKLAPNGTPFYKTFYTAIAPRLGMAYQLRTKPGQETVLRGSFGVYYDLGASGATLGFPLTSSKGLPDVVAFPECQPPIIFPLPPACGTPLPPVVPTSLPVGVTVFSNAEDLRLPYSLHWNLGVEQSLGKKQVLSVSYVASAGRDLLVGSSLNSVPTNIPRPNPNFASIRHMFNGSSSDYNSMQVQYRVRFGRSLQAIANYTWSHSIDEISEDVVSGFVERGNSSFDVRHNFNTAVHYELPNLKAGALLDAVLNGWSLDSIIRAQSGSPVNIVLGTLLVSDGEELSRRPNLVLGQPLYLDDPSVPGGRRFNTAAFSTPPSTQRGNFGRNVMRALPIQQIDISLGRTIKLNERFGLQLKGDVFNIFNHPMFSGYVTNVTSPAFGVPASTLNNGLGGLGGVNQLGGPRSIQLSAKVVF